MMRGYLKVLVLKTLKKGDKTGYGLMKSIEQETGRKPSFGSIYPLLEHLAKENIVSYKEKDKKKIYSLTDKGQEQLKCVINKKDEMVGKLEEAMKIFEIVHGKSLGPYQKRMMDKIKEEKIDLTNVMPPEVIKMKELWAKLVVEDKIIEHKKEINDIIKKANQELRKIK